jgi:hypothetical protein
MLMSIVFNLSSIAMLAVPANGAVFNWLLSAAAALITAIMMAMYENKNNRSQLDAAQEPPLHPPPNAKFSLAPITMN